LCRRGNERTVNRTRAQRSRLRSASHRCRDFGHLADPAYRSDSSDTGFGLGGPWSSHRMRSRCSSETARSAVAVGRSRFDPGRCAQRSYRAVKTPCLGGFIVLSRQSICFSCVSRTNCEIERLKPLADPMDYVADGALLRDIVRLRSRVPPPCKGSEAFEFAQILRGLLASEFGASGRAK
jgi:hypothetical protein